MSAITQEMRGRWQETPEPTYSIRTELLAWTKAGRSAVYAFVDRQRTPAVNAWLEARAERYRQLFPAEKPLRLWHEAAADLVAWQRQVKAEEAIQWVEEWEEI